VKWSGIQNILEEAQSDVLLLLDCCNAGTANTNEGEGVTELISACAWNSTANGVGPYSFTNALVIELQDLAKKPSFSTGELYSNIFSRIQGRMPENGMERHPAPVHLVLTNDTQFPRSIQLSKRLMPEIVSKACSESTNLSVQSNDNAVDLEEEGSSRIRGSAMSTLTSSCESGTQIGMQMEGHHEPSCGDKVPRLAFAIRLRDNFQVGELSTDLFLEWLRNIPTIADQVKVEAGFDSFSSLLIVSIPLSISGYLPPDRAVISLGPINSSNLIPNSPRSHSSEPGLLDFQTATKYNADSAISRSIKFSDEHPPTYLDPYGLLEVRREFMSLYSMAEGKWLPFLAYLDTGTRGNWISETALAALGLKPRLETLKAEDVEFSGKNVKFPGVEITWRARSTSEVRKSTFRVVKSTSFAVVLGSKLLQVETDIFKSDSVKVETANSGRWTKSWFKAPTSSPSALEDKPRQAVRDRGILGESIKLKGLQLRPGRDSNDDRAGSGRSTESSYSRDESDYKKSATTRTARSMGDDIDENVATKVTGTAHVSAGGTQIIGMEVERSKPNAR
jgi:hypothetical protein